VKVLNVAIIGQGRSGRNIHGAHIHKDDRFKVVAVVDAIAERRERALQEYPGCDVYATYQELFGRTDIDFVINATYSYMHQPIAVDLMRHGFNVLQEKPIAANRKELEELEATIRETGRMYAIFLQSRYRAQFRKVKEITDSGILGRLVEIKITANGYNRRWDWQTVQEYVAGSLYNTGPHPVGWALEFLNYYDGMPEVYCKMDNVNSFGDAEDFVKLLLSAPNRPLIDLEISACDAWCPYVIQAHGDHGSLTTDGKTIRYKYWKDEEAPAQKLIRESLADENGLPIYCSEKLPMHEEVIDLANVQDNVFADDTKCLYDDVYNYLTEGKALPVAFKQVAQQIKIMEICHLQNPMPRLDK